MSTVAKIGKISLGLHRAALEVLDRAVEPERWPQDSILSPFRSELAALFSCLDHSVSNQLVAGRVPQLNKLLESSYSVPAARVGVSGSSLHNIVVNGFVLPRIARKVAQPAVLVDRDAHGSIFGAIYVSGHKVFWLYRRYFPEHDAQAPISALDVDIALSDHPEIVAVCLISPTYDGSDADIPAIAQVCHSHGALLIVDAAWGAFYGLLEKVGFPPRPLALGADIEITSLHKKNLGPSQIAAAFFSHPSMAAHFDVASSIGFETTSIFLPSLGITEHNLREAANGSLARRWVKALGNIEAFREQLSKIHPKCRSIRPSALGSNSGDPGHVLVHVGDLGVIGYDLDRELQKRSVVPEKATRDTVLLLFGPQEAESYERRLEQLAAAIAACPRHSAMKLRASREALTPPTIRARAELSIREALLAPIEQVSLENAANRIAAQVIAPYPPGSALLVPGERIDPVQIDYARAVKKHGGKIRGLSEDISSATLYVVIE